MSLSALLVVHLEAGHQVAMSHSRIVRLDPCAATRKTSLSYAAHPVAQEQRSTGPMTASVWPAQRADTRRRRCGLAATTSAGKTWGTTRMTAATLLSARHSG